MKLRTFSIALTLALLAAFTALNWGPITAPTELSLGFTRVQAPLGLVILGATVLVSALFLLYIALQQAGVILEARRTARELKSHRELADQAEASRFTALQAYLADEIKRMDALRSAEAARIETLAAQLEQRVAARLDESTRVLSSFIGEVEDKLERSLADRER